MHHFNRISDYLSPPLFEWWWRGNHDADVSPLSSPTQISSSPLYTKVCFCLSSIRRKNQSNRTRQEFFRRTSSQPFPPIYPFSSLWLLLILNIHAQKNVRRNSLNEFDGCQATHKPYIQSMAPLFWLLSCMMQTKHIKIYNIRKYKCNMRISRHDMNRQKIQWPKLHDIQWNITRFPFDTSQQQK